MNITHYKDLIVWQKSMDLVSLTYQLCLQLPKEELFGLRNQMQRSCVSIPSNIAEGSARSGKRDYANFLRIAKGSLYELETQIIICKKQYNIYDEKLNNLLIEVNKMLSVLIKKLTPEN